MIVYLIGNDLPLKSNLDRTDFLNLERMFSAGDISVSLSVMLGERVGYIPLDDIDIERTKNDLANYP